MDFGELNRAGHRSAKVFLVISCLALSLFINAPSVAKDPTTAPAETDTAADESYDAIEPFIGMKGDRHDGVLTFHIPRKDLEGRLFNELGDVPVAAGIEARFDFFKCPCGKVNVIGQFVVTQEELNDVIDALRKTYYIKIVAVSPIMLGEKPRLQVIRFQGDGQAQTLASYLKNALNQIGDARLTPTTQP